MEIRSRIPLLATLLLVLGLAACSDDDSPTGGGTPDTTPPGVTTVTPVDAFHIDVTFNEQVSKSSAEDDSHYSLTQATVVAAAPRGELGAPGDPVAIAAASLKTDQKTVTLSTETSMAGLNLGLSVQGVADTHGNDITEPVGKTFTGSSDPDVTAPTIASRSPAPGATNVPVGTTVTIQFSEPVTTVSFNNGVTWSSGGGPVTFSVQEDQATFVLTPGGPLNKNTVYTVSVTGVEDPAGNAVTTTEWSFTTTNVADHTPPTLVSSSPANLATNVDVNTNLSATFSEPIDQDNFYVSVAPDPGDGTATWSPDGKTVTFDPDVPLLDNQQYTIAVYPDDVFDLAGNSFADFRTVVFTTGSALEAGSIAGTISGDPGTAAADPTGAFVIVSDGNQIIATTIVADNNTYLVSHLPDGQYYLACALETSGDGFLDPTSGDAAGAYGVNLVDFEPDSVVIAGGNHATGKNFAIYDASSITGTVTYGGTHANESHLLHVGLFSTAGFSPTDDPLFTYETFWPDAKWYFSQWEWEYPDGNYYVGAFLDVNDNFTFEPGIDPSGFYGGLPTPTSLHVANGSDVVGIVIPMVDPAPGASSSAISAWPAAKHDAKLQRLFDVVRQARLHASK
jgi:hypothetical protein